MADRLDMTAMFAMHDALRRELHYLTRAAADPRRMMSTTVGWELFKKSLHIHHTAEDDALWPALRATLSGRPDELALLDAMEAEHALIDPLIEAIDVAMSDPDTEPAVVGSLADELADALTAHLKHEENEAIPLIQATATPQQWAHFSQVHGQRIGPDAPRLLPWLLDEATEETAATMLASLPEAARAAYADQWRPAYNALDRWNPYTPV
ncbi:hemerythrin domain-containing protein [Streptomyces sp. P1-3]|uniref:hemerythrin domain-containing protein n=1 Tax=Streptomyces sp. P1-3 TaxID=3421658 RepID=UPI003D363E23